MHSTDYNKTEPVKKVTSICYCWVMGNQTFFTKSKILEKVVKPNLRSIFLKVTKVLLKSNKINVIQV